MKKTFLYKVWLHDKKLFFVITGFTLLTLFFNLLGDEVTPFFVWGMYSEKEQPATEYQLLKTTINDSLTVDGSSGYASPTLFYMGTPLAYYRRIKENNNTDPVIPFLQSKTGAGYRFIQPLEKKLFNTGPQQQAFLNWYRCYLQQVMGISIHHLKIDIIEVHYSNTQHIITDTAYLFEKWERS